MKENDDMENKVRFCDNDDMLEAKFFNYEIRIVPSLTKYSVTFFEFRDAFLIPCFDLADFECVREKEEGGCSYNVTECPDRLLLKNAELSGINTFDVKESLSREEDMKEIKRRILSIARGENDVDYVNGIKGCTSQVLKVLEDKWYIYGMEI